MASSSLFALCSTVMLLLLVQLCRVSSGNSNGSLLAFNKNVDLFRKHVQNCSYNCSLVPVNDLKCKCLNLSKSDYGCDFPDYFIEALKSLLDRSKDREVQALWNNFSRLNQTFRRMLCPSNLAYDPVVSPRLLSDKLIGLKEQLNTVYSNRRT